MKPTISIIIPVYNVEQYLKQCLDSLLVDNHFTGQVICVNDGSTDECLTILEQYANKYPNVEFCSQENQGQSVARNTGLEHAIGDYVLFLDSDDYFSKGAIDLLNGLATQNPDVDFFYMDCAVSTEGGRFYTLHLKEPVKMSLVDYYDYEYAQFGSTPQGCVCGGFYKRDFIERNRLRMLPHCRYEDELFIFEVFMKEGTCMALHVDEPFYNYRIRREGATTAHYSLTHFFDRRTIIHACFERMQAANMMTKARINQVFGLCEENVCQAYLNGFKRVIPRIMNGEDLDMMRTIAIDDRQKKVCRIVKISPRLFAAYRTEQLPNIVRRLINRYL